MVLEGSGLICACRLRIVVSDQSYFKKSKQENQHRTFPFV
jgi:hypothetical protein